LFIGFKMGSSGAEVFDRMDDKSVIIMRYRYHDSRIGRIHFERSYAAGQVVGAAKAGQSLSAVSVRASFTPRSEKNSGRKTAPAGIGQKQMEEPVEVRLGAWRRQAT
jgi:hypothetical protein